MAERNTTLTFTATALLATGAIWPWIVGAVSYLLLTPYERALRAAWCGVTPHAQFAMLGHCPACWAGSAAFALAALVFMDERSGARLALSFAAVR